MPDPGDKLFALRPDAHTILHLVREWLGGGQYLNPAACSPFESRSLIFEGWRTPLPGDSSSQDQFLGYSLWKRLEDQQRRLLLPGVIARPGQPVWSE